MTRTTLPDFLTAIQAFQALQNQYLTHPSQKKALLPLLAQAASETDKTAARYHADNLEGNDHPTPTDHAGAILWSHYQAARTAFRAYKAQRNRSTKIALRDAEHSLKKHAKSLSENLHKIQS